MKSRKSRLRRLYRAWQSRCSLLSRVLLFCLRRYLLGKLNYKTVTFHTSIGVRITKSVLERWTQSHTHVRAVIGEKSCLAARRLYTSVCHDIAI